MKLKFLAIFPIILVLISIIWLVNFQTFSFDWENAKTDDFVNKETTPYKHSGIPMPRSLNHFENISIYSSNSGESEILGLSEVSVIVLEYFSTFTSDSRLEQYVGYYQNKSNNPSVTVLQSKIKNQNLYILLSRDDNSYLYTWQQERFIFLVGGTNERKVHDTAGWIISQYNK